MYFLPFGNKCKTFIVSNTSFDNKCISCSLGKPHTFYFNPHNKNMKFLVIFVVAVEWLKTCLIPR